MSAYTENAYPLTAKDADGNAGRPVREELERVENAAGLLDERLGTLLNRLEPVLMPSPPVERLDRLQSVPREAQAPMVEQLRTIAEHLGRIEARVDSTLTHLQV